MQNKSMKEKLDKKGNIFPPCTEIFEKNFTRKLTILLLLYKQQRSSKKANNFTIVTKYKMVKQEILRPTLLSHCSIFKALFTYFEI